MCVLFFFTPPAFVKTPLRPPPSPRKNPVIARAQSARGNPHPVLPKNKKGETIMTFSDIFKSSFLENVTSVSVLDMVLTLGLTVAFLYRKKG